MRFLVMGSLNYDYTYFVDHIVRPGETIASGRLERACGGKGFNQAAALAKAGAKVFLAGLTGPDGDDLVRAAKDFGVDCAFLARTQERTGNAIIQVEEGGQNSIVLFGGANRKWTQQYREEVLGHFGKGDVLILQNEVNDGNGILRCAKERGLKIVLNPSPFEPDIVNWDLEKVSLFLFNEVEGEQMTGEKEPEKILNCICARYPAAAAVLTLGEKGAWYAQGEERIFCPARKTQAVDTTAAGDTFTGYFLSAQSRGMAPKQCLEIAAAAAAVAVSRKGASVSIPVWEEIAPFTSALPCAKVNPDV